ncbi:MAG: PadR family transcriptional regulator [Cellulosilyticaceae bacterium]
MSKANKVGALTEVTLYILLALYKPNHGYGIMQFVEEKTEGRLTLGAGTLYGAITTLVEKGWISQQGEEGIKKKKTYLITSQGREIVEGEMERLQEVLRLGKSIMRGDEVDE